MTVVYQEGGQTRMKSAQKDRDKLVGHAAH
jgi:hypothetical protein